MKAVNLLVDESLPEGLKGAAGSLSAKDMDALMARLARSHPELYAAVTKKLGDIGRNASYYQGETITLADMFPVVDKQSVFDDMDARVAELDPNDPDFGAKRQAIWQDASDRLEKATLEAALRNDNGIATAVASGAKGKSNQLKMMITTPALYSDAKGAVIPKFVRRSFSEGIRPADFLASTYGARAAVLCLAQDTLVRMADGTAKPIQEIREGEFVLGADVEGRTAPTKVVRTYQQGLMPVNRYVFRTSVGDVTHEVLCTEEHKFLINDTRQHSRVRAKHARGNGPAPTTEDRHATRVDTLHSPGTRKAVLLERGGDVKGTAEPFALLLGLLTGDGGLTGGASGHPRLRFFCADDSLIQDIEEYVGSLGLRCTKHHTNDTVTQYEFTKVNYTPEDNGGIQKGVQGFVPGTLIEHKQKVESEGLLGKYAHEKMLPASIWEWDRDSVAAYVSGLVATDGCVYVDSSGRPHLSLYLTAKDLVFDVRRLLQHVFGTHTSGVHKREKGGFGDPASARVHPLFGFSVTSWSSLRPLLEALIPHIPGAKRGKVLDCLDFTLKQNNPYPKAFLQTIEPAGTVPCFDIEVDNEDHLFVLDSGLITSNSTKRATAAGGDLGKQMVAAAADLVVTKKDCGTSNGIDLAADDPSLRGRILVKDTAGIPAGTVLDKEEVAHLRKENPSNVVVRSALTCENGEGLCANCVGKFYNREFPKIGDAVGMIASQSIGEPITQNALNVKHQGGASKGKKQTFSGFDVVNQIFQSPKNFPNRAAVSEVEGVVKGVDTAPQGGKYIVIGDKKHYVLPGMEVLVKPGQQVEAGDQLSDGIVDAGDVVRLRGLGSGRRYFSDRMKQALDDSGLWADARNVEIVSRNVINHAKILDDEGLPGMLPDDLVSYNRFASKYIPAADTARVPTRDAAGKYLQVPALHYSVGTKLTNKMVKRLESTGSTELYVSDKAPQYEPVMNRLRTSSQTNPDWLARQHSSFLKKHLSDAAVRGEDTDTQSNIHFAPRLAVGKDFGKNVTTGGHF